MRGKARVIVNGEGCNPCTSKTAEQQIEEVIENAENVINEANEVIQRMEQTYANYAPDGNVELGEQRSVNGETIYQYLQQYYTQPEVDQLISEGIVNANASFVPVSGTALPTPSESPKVSFVGSGTYTHSGGNVTVPSGFMGVINWNGTQWSLGSTIAMPEANGLVAEGDTRAVSGSEIFRELTGLRNIEATIPNIKFEPGSFNGAGADVTSSTRYRTQRITLPTGKYLVEWKNTTGNVTINRSGVNTNHTTPFYVDITTPVEVRFSVLASNPSELALYDFQIVNMQSQIYKLEDGVAKTVKQSENIADLSLARRGSLNGAGNVIGSFNRFYLELTVPAGTYTISVNTGFNYGYYYFLDGVGQFVASKTGETTINHSGGILRVSVGVTSGVTFLAREQFLNCGLAIKKNVDSKAIEIPFTWEAGTIDGVGENVSSTTRLRTPKLSGSVGDRFLILLKAGYRYSFNNLRSTDKQRVNLAVYTAVGYVIADANDFFRVSVTKMDNTLPTTGELADVKIYKLPKRSDVNFNIVIAAPDSEIGDKLEADFVVDGGNDDAVLNAAVNMNFVNVTAKILPGSYNLKNVAPVTTAQAMGGNDGCVISYSYGVGFVKSTKIEGHGVSKNGAVLTPTFVVDQNITNTNNYVSLFRVNSGYSTDVSAGFGFFFTCHHLIVSGVAFFNKAYDRAVILIDGFMAFSFLLENIRSYNNDIYLGPTAFTFIPRKAIAYRGTQGSNAGIYNKLSKLVAYGFFKGFDIGGEHFILEDCLAHHCYWGFAFSDYLAKRQLEHPNMMIGCSIEQCFNAVRLGRYGYENLEDIPSGFSRNQTLICLGLSTEPRFHTEGLESEGFADGSHRMKGVTEVIENTWRGTFETDTIDNKLFEKGGNMFKQRMYNHLLSGTIGQRNAITYPTYLQEFFVVSENKMYRYNGQEWI